MKEFDHTLNWKLLAGSHEFPGPDGGTCINEAAIVAAGLPYRKVRDGSRMPPCFSRVLSFYALMLNDQLPDRERQGLIRFVSRLAGTNVGADSEVKRTQAIAFHILTRVVPILLEESGHGSLASVLRDTTEYKAAFHFVKDILADSSYRIKGDRLYLRDAIKNLTHVEDGDIPQYTLTLCTRAVAYLASDCCHLHAAMKRSAAHLERADSTDVPQPNSLLAIRSLSEQARVRRRGDAIVQHAFDALEAGINVIPPVEVDLPLVAERLEKAKSLRIEVQPVHA
jgi:hypothetical protein